MCLGFAHFAAAAGDGRRESRTQHAPVANYGGVSGDLRVTVTMVRRACGLIFIFATEFAFGGATPATATHGFDGICVFSKGNNTDPAGRALISRWA